jgi:hypothetical protein
LASKLVVPPMWCYVSIMSRMWARFGLTVAAAWNGPAVTRRCEGSLPKPRREHARSARAWRGKARALLHGNTRTEPEGRPSVGHVPRRLHDHA